MSSTDKESSAGSAVAKEVERLSKYVCIARTLLTDAEEKETISEFDKHYLYELKEFTYDAEDILSDFNYNWVSMEMEYQHQIESRKRKFEVTDSIFPPSPRYDSSFMSKIEKYIKRFDEICHDRDTLGLREEDGIRKYRPYIRSPSSSFLDLSEIFGRETEKKEVLDALLTNIEPLSTRKKTIKTNVDIIALVGIAGMGKTTLAKLVFNEKTIHNYFPLRTWVWVSEFYDVITLTKSILESFTGRECSLCQLDPLRSELASVLAGKTFFLVLNDLKEEISNCWEEMQWMVSYGAKDSRILITKENNTIAERVGTSMSISLSGLSRIDSWELFSHHAFNGRILTMIPLNILEIGQKIIDKCNGVPIMVKSLAGLLASSIKEKTWEDILKSNVWDPEECRKNMHILSLSYHSLPTYLKPCFRSCAMFPKGHEFETDSLVRIWAAQGLIRAEYNKQIDAGRTYVDALMQRSFFQNKIVQGRKSRFTMHNLMHDLSTWIVGRETSIIENQAIGNKNICEHFRHLSSLTQNMDMGLASVFQLIKEKEDYRHLTVVVKNDGHISFNPFQRCRALRSLLIYNYNQTRFDLDMHFFNQASLQYLQVLDLNFWRAVELPESISNFKHLRFLGLSGQNLPESICTLHNLQTVQIRTHGNHLSLPKKIRHLKNLQHLIFSPWDVSAMPIGIGGLTNLQSLSAFAVSKEGSAKLNELNRLNNLRDELHITGLHQILKEHVCRSINPDLLSKEYLTHLTLQWSTFIKTQTLNNDEELLKILQPHTNIQHVVVDGYRGAYLPPWFENRYYASLTYLKLDNCTNCRKLPAIGQLPALKHLKLEGFKSLQTVGEDFYGYYEVSFPSLETLSFYNMHELEKWHCRIADGSVFPCLHELHMSFCQKLRFLELPNLPMLQKASFNWCKQLAGIEGLDGNWLVIDSWRGTSTVRPIMRGKLRNKPNGTQSIGSSVLKLEKKTEANNSHSVSPTLIVVIRCPILEQNLSIFNVDEKNNTGGTRSSTVRKSPQYVLISVDMSNKMTDKPTGARSGSSEYVEPELDKERKLLLEKDQLHLVEGEENQGAFSMEIVGPSVALEEDSRVEEKMISDSDEDIFSFDKTAHLSIGEKDQNSPMSSFVRKSPTSLRNRILLGIQSMISEPPASIENSITPPTEKLYHTSY